MGPYILQKTLVKHGDSINALAFSYDGLLFASGADDGLVIVFKGNGCGRELRRFQLKAPVTALLWHSRFGYTIIAGDASGDVHSISLNDSEGRNAYYHTFNNVPGPVHSIVQSGTLLAISSGNVVQLIKQGTMATWEVVARLPDPPKFPELEGELPEPIARSLHFLGVESDVLLTTYLDHGVIAWNVKTLEIKWRIRPRSCKIGCSAVSPNQRVLAVTNLYDGIDWYSLDSNHFTDTPFQHTTTHSISENVILPVTFIHGGTAVLSGTSTGCARTTSLKDHTLVETFPHDCDIVQAVAYAVAEDCRQIITGVSERGPETVIKYWILPRTSKRVQPRPKTAKERMMELLTTRRMTWAAITILAGSIAFWYWPGDAQRIPRAGSWVGDILSMPPSLTLPWKQSGVQSMYTDLGNDRWDILWPDEPSSSHINKLRDGESPE